MRSLENQIPAHMSLRWRNILLSLSAASLVVTSCSKKISSDNPLPTTYIPSVIISSDNNVLYGIDPSSGKKNWEYALPFHAAASGIVFMPSPLLYHEMIYQPSAYSDTIYKINSETGAIVKKIVLLDPTITTPTPLLFNVQSTPIADANLVYLTTMNGSIYAFDTGTYKVKWSYGGDATGCVSSPVIYNGNVFFATTGGHVYCLDKTAGPDASGYPIWAYPGPDTPPLAANPQFNSSPAICPPYLYIGSASDSNMYCIYLTPPADPLGPSLPVTNAARWTYKTFGAINSSPTASYGKCIFGSNDFNVYCLDTSLSAITGTAGLIWKYPTTSQINSSPIISNQVVYIASYDYNLYSLNIIDGTVKWKFATTGLVKSSPVPYNGSILVASYDGYLYAVDSSQGTLQWKYNVSGNIQSSPVVDNLTGGNFVSQISGFVN